MRRSSDHFRQSRGLATTAMHSKAASNYGASRREHKNAKRRHDATSQAPMRQKRERRLSAFAVPLITACALTCQHRRYQRRPSCLMRGTETFPCVAMKIFVEGQAVAPGGVPLKEPVLSKGGSSSVIIAQEKPEQSALEFFGHLFKGREPARAGGQFDGKIFPEACMQVPQGFDGEKIQGKPDGSAPIRVAAEQAGAGLRG